MINAELLDISEKNYEKCQNRVVAKTFLFTISGNSKSVFKGMKIFFNH